jgi:ElaA protein
MPELLAWHDRAFGELTAAELYAILELRARVFVVEQKCAYLDPDGLDRTARHVWGARDGEIVAYARILPAPTRIGRVVTAPEVRGTGVGRELMRRAIATITGPIRLSAQAHLERFYNDFGFVRVGDPYDEDGIPHIGMIKPA